MHKVCIILVYLLIRVLAVRVIKWGNVLERETITVWAGCSDSHAPELQRRTMRSGLFFWTLFAAQLGRG